MYRFYGDDLPLQDVIATVPSLSEGGTLGVLLAEHALRRGYSATIYTYNLQVFDPSWFAPVLKDLAACLRAQAEVKSGRRLQLATEGYLEFLALGGHVRFEPLTRGLFERLLSSGQPVLTGLSATYLYEEPREVASTCEPDDISGVPTGHFVVLCGLDASGDEIWIADPLHPNSLSATHLYPVQVDKLLGAIMLGAMTYDAILLAIGPRRATAAAGGEGPWMSS